MSIFGTIMGKIFGHAEAASASTASAPSQGSMNNPTSAPASPGGSAAPTAGASPAAMAPVDVEQVLTGLASHNAQTLDWRHSIVDLMKLLDLDSSLAARKELAHELNYSGSTDDSAAMNIWLHKQVMAKLAANGGKVPDDLK